MVQDGKTNGMVSYMGKHFNESVSWVENFCRIGIFRLSTCNLLDR